MISIYVEAALYNKTFLEIFSKARARPKAIPNNIARRVRLKVSFSPPIRYGKFCIRILNLNCIAYLLPGLLPKPLFIDLVIFPVCFDFL